ncbi:MAG: C40 family peptidase [Pseudonocardiaceae bacterium]
MITIGSVPFANAQNTTNLDDRSALLDEQTEAMLNSTQRDLNTLGAEDGPGEATAAGTVKSPVVTSSTADGDGRTKLSPPAPASSPPNPPEPAESPLSGAAPAESPPSAPEPAESPSSGAAPAESPPSAPAPAESPPPVEAAVADRPESAALTAVAFAREQLGKPYVWGGNGSPGFDCSGLTKAAFAAAKIAIPRTAQTQYNHGPRLPAGAKLHPGDLLFFGTPRKIHHVGISLGGTLMIHSPTFGQTVSIQDYRKFRDYAGASRPTA